jgi:hypothetical protein
MPLTARQQAKVLDWLRVKCPDFRCPACGDADWGVGELVQLIPARLPGACGSLSGNGGPSAPPVPLVCVGCNNCACVVQFSAVVLGLVPAAAAHNPGG